MTMTSSNEPEPLHYAPTRRVVEPMVDSYLVENVDIILDRDCSQPYHDQPLAQDWARVCKRIEEHGESIEKLILATGQNPRKGTDPTARELLLEELADTAMSAIYAIQHFTKDIGKTTEVMRKVQERHQVRLMRS